MNNIEWKDGAVCYAYKRQWFFDGSGMLACDFQTVKCEAAIIMDDFQLNEIREGDFIPASELDTEQKYNEVVEVFGLSGFGAYEKLAKRALRPANKVFMVCNGIFVGCAVDYEDLTRKLTYSQIIAIGKLKRMMLEREVGKVNKEFNKSEIESVLTNADIYSVENFPKLDLEEKPKPKRRNKSKQAYDTLKSLDYEYDLVKQKWFKKVYIND